MLRHGLCRVVAVIATATGTCRADEPATAPVAAASPARTTPLDLSHGDLTRFLDAAELAKPLPDDLEEIIVDGKRPEPIPERSEVPQGLFPALIYAGKNPLSAWRILAPDPNVEIPDRTEDDVREPPGAFRGRILEPGAIHD
jgi:hypothetical protein